MIRWALAITASVTVAALQGCDGQSESLRGQVRCDALGQQLNDQPLEGIFLGEIGTKIRTKACPGLDMGFASIGELPQKLTRLAKKSQETMEPVGFKAVSSGFIVRNGNEYTFIAMHLYDVQERLIEQRRK